MARKLEVEIIASTLGYTKGLTKAGEQTKLFARTVDESSKHIGRSLAFATGGFVAFAGASEFLRSSIDAARDAGVSQRQLAAQMKASGDSFTQSKDRIEQAGLALERFGFTSEDSAKALTVLERGTGNITRAISLQGTAANLARAKNIDLASAANVLAKVFGGQETALRRAVPGLDKHAHGLDLITEAQKRLAGQAAASTTPAERFQATLHDTEVIIGTALLPTIDKYLGELGKWLDKMNRSGQLQKDVNGAVKTATGLFNDLKPILDAVVGSFNALSDAVGSTKAAVELLVGVFAAWKLSGLIGRLTGLSGSVGGVGRSAKASTGEVAGLRGALTRLGGMGVIAVTVAVGYEVAKYGTQFSNYLGKQGISGVGNVNFPPGSLPAMAADAIRSGTSMSKFVEGAGLGGVSKADATRAYKQAQRALTYTVTRPSAVNAAVNAAVAGTVKGLPGTVAGRTVGNLTPAQQLQVALARDPNNIGLLNQQAAADRNAIAFLNRLHARGKGPGTTKLTAELTGFYNDLTSTLATIASIRDAGTKAAAAALHLPGRLGGSGRGALRLPGQVGGSGATSLGSFIHLPGLVGGSGGYSGQFQTSTGLQVDLAREQATGKSMTATLKAVRAAARKALRTQKLSWQEQIDAYNAITDVNQQLASSAKGVKDTFRQQRGRAVALAGAQGMGYQYAYAAGPTIHIEHFHSSASSPKALEEEFARRANARAHVRRGAR